MQVIGPEGVDDVPHTEPFSTGNMEGALRTSQNCPDKHCADEVGPLPGKLPYLATTACL